MAFSDSDRISKEEHELDYVLKKWGKRATKANREELASALDAFNADTRYPDHDRNAFYKYAEEKGIASRLEGRSEETVFGTASTAIEDSVPAGFPSWLKWLLIILAVVVLIILIILFARGCSQPAPATTQTAAVTTDRVPDIAAGNASGAATDAASSLAAQTTAAPTPAPRVLNLSALAPELLAFGFLPDATRDLQSGTEAKVAALAAVLNAFDSGTLVLSGHAASIGYPEGELRVSQGRVDYLAQRLKDAGLGAGIQIVTEAFGATKPRASNSTEDGRRQNRRVEISVR